MKRNIHILIWAVALLVMFATDLCAQVDKKDVRRGNRDFRKENFREAEIDYRKALVKDSVSIAANYNLASTLYRQGDMEQAEKVMKRIEDVIGESASKSDYYYNLGDIALAKKDYRAAVDAFKKSLVVNPSDLDAKENYIYAKKKLEQQNQQNQQNQNKDNKDNKDQDQNKDQNNKDQSNKDQDQNKDQNQDNQQNKDNSNQDDNKDNNGGNDRQQNPGQNSENQPNITPQAAQQMLQAIQAKEKETQDKVKKEKAKALKNKQKDKNW